MRACVFYHPRCPACTGRTARTRTRCSPRRGRTYRLSPEGRLGRTWDRRREDDDKPDLYTRRPALLPMRSPHRSSDSGAHGDHSSNRSRSGFLGSVRGAGDLCGNVGTPPRVRRSDADHRIPSATPSQTLMAAQGLSPSMRRAARGSSLRRRDAVPPQTGTLPRKPGAARLRKRVGQSLPFLVGPATLRLPAVIVGVALEALIARRAAHPLIAFGRCP